MAISIGDLIRIPALSLRVLVSTAEMALPVMWAHVSELSDPTPYLEGGELLLTTGPWISEGVAVDDYVARLKSANVVGLGFGAHVWHDEVPAELIVSAQKFEMPLLEVPPQTPFIAISKTVSRALAAEALAAVTAAFEAQRALTSAAAKPGGATSVARVLQRLLGGWVLLLDAHGSIVEAAPPSIAQRHTELQAEVVNVRTRKASTAMLAGADESILICALGIDTQKAFLLVGTPGAHSSINRQVVNTAVALLTLNFERGELLADVLARLRARVLGLLRSGAVAQAVGLMGDFDQQMPAEPLLHVLVRGSSGASQGLGAALVATSGMTGEPVLQAYDGMLSEIVVPADGALDALLAAAAARFPGLRVGVSVAPSLNGLARSHEQAYEALSRTTAQHPLVSYRDIGATSFLHILPEHAAKERAWSLLRPVVEADPDGRGGLLKTLRAWLAHHGQWDTTAAELRIHRHTVHARVDRVEGLLKRDLQSAAVRTELWLALALLREDRLRM